MPPLMHEGLYPPENRVVSSSSPVVTGSSAGISGSLGAGEPNTEVPAAVALPKMLVLPGAASKAVAPAEEPPKVKPEEGAAAGGALASPAVAPVAGAEAEGTDAAVPETPNASEELLVVAAKGRRGGG
jgi:hypothetical protein